MEDKIEFTLFTAYLLHNSFLYSITTDLSMLLTPFKYIQSITLCIFNFSVSMVFDNLQYTFYACFGCINYYIA